MKRVLIIVENLPVPFDTRVWKEACALKENDYQVFVICPKGKGYESKHECHNRIHIYRHPMPKEGNGAIGYVLEYSVALFWEFLLSWKIFFRHRFHIIQGCNPPDTIFLVALMFKVFGVKYVFDHHDVNPELYYAKFGRKDLLYRIQEWLEKITFKVSDVVISTNKTYRGVAVGRGKRPPERVFVVRNGPDIKTFRPVPPIPHLKYGKPFLVGYVGTMSIQEGLDILLEAAHSIKKQGRNDVHFTCVGGGPELKELVKMKSDMGLDDIFDFTGRVPDHQLLDILSTADICVNPDRPSVMNNMSTMIKIMEYMALGKPIVQFDLDEGKYSAQKASLYVKAESGKVFAESILWLLDHPEQRVRMGEFGMKRVREKLAWQYSVPNLLLAYKKAFEG